MSFGSPQSEHNGPHSKGKAFLTSFLQAERRLFAYILTLVPHRADAEDLFQEVSITMWEKYDEEHPPHDFVAWGCRIAFFGVRHYYRTRRRQRVMFSEEVLNSVAERAMKGAESLLLDERHDALKHCLEKLGHRDRELLAARLEQGATAESAARQTGRSVAAVYKALAKIRHALYECVGRTIAAEGRP